MLIAPVDMALLPAGGRTSADCNRSLLAKIAVSVMMGGGLRSTWCSTEPSWDRRTASDATLLVSADMFNNVCALSCESDWPRPAGGGGGGRGGAKLFEFVSGLD